MKKLILAIVHLVTRRREIASLVEEVNDLIELYQDASSDKKITKDELKNMLDQFVSIITALNELI